MQAVGEEGVCGVGAQVLQWQNGGLPPRTVRMVLMPGARAWPPTVPGFQPARFPSRTLARRRKGCRGGATSTPGAGTLSSTCQKHSLWV